MFTTLRKLHLIALVALVGGLVGCSLDSPSIILDGPAGPYSVSGAPVTLAVTGSPGSSAGLWIYTFTATPACGTFTIPDPPGASSGNGTATATSNPTNLTTFDVAFTPTTPTTGCVLTATLTTASGRTAMASITRDVVP